jgi:hypothetical protein
LNEVRASTLRLGQLVAEGGEGRVFEVLAGPPELAGTSVYKQLRSPRPLGELSSLVSFPSLLACRSAPLAARALSSSAWPVSSIVGDDPAVALGTVMPRAPAQFWLRHRDGTKRLATLSYLATDPERIAVAYGVLMPPPGAAERIALVYAFARLLEAWQSEPPLPRVVHGDLSSKNVLWSLQPVPAVYVLDCDGASLRCGADEMGGDALEGEVPEGDVSEDDLPGGADRRPRATTPNWDDPALAPGSQPTRWSDRYMLGITFLRVVGAAHFPLQGLQRSAEHVNVDLELPRSWRKVPDLPALWELCERSLSLADVEGRPSPREWAAELEHVLDVLSAPALGAAVREAQGDPRRARGAVADVNRGEAKRLAVSMAAVADVSVRPVLRRRAPSTWQLVNASGPPIGASGDVVGGGAAASAASWWAGRGAAAGAPLTWRQMTRRLLAAWGGAHLLAIGWARSPGRRAFGLRRLAGALIVDLAAACVVLFIFAMLVSPWIGL